MSTIFNEGPMYGTLKVKDEKYRESSNKACHLSSKLTIALSIISLRSQRRAGWYYQTLL